MDQYYPKNNYLIYTIMAKKSIIYINLFSKFMKKNTKVNLIYSQLLAKLCILL